MTKGQRAMAVAMIYPEPAALKRAGSVVATDQTVSAGQISHARTVLRFTPEAVPVVMSWSSAAGSTTTSATFRIS